MWCTTRKGNVFSFWGPNFAVQSFLLYLDALLNASTMSFYCKNRRFMRLAALEGPHTQSVNMVKYLSCFVPYLQRPLISWYFSCRILWPRLRSYWTVAPATGKWYIIWDVVCGMLHSGVVYSSINTTLLLTMMMRYSLVTLVVILGIFRTSTGASNQFICHFTFSYILIKQLTNCNWMTCRGRSESQ